MSQLYIKEKIELVDEITNLIIKDLKLTDENKIAYIKKKLTDSTQDELERFYDAIYRFGADAIMEAVN